jgi:hypothetical protein
LDNHLESGERLQFVGNPGDEHSGGIKQSRKRSSFHSICEAAEMLEMPMTLAEMQEMPMTLDGSDGLHRGSNVFQKSIHPVGRNIAPKDTISG